MHPEPVKNCPGAWMRCQAPGPARHMRQVHGRGARSLVTCGKKSQFCDFLW